MFFFIFLLLGFFWGYGCFLCFFCSCFLCGVWYFVFVFRGRRGRERMVVGFKSYLCNQFLPPLTLWVRFPLRRGVLDTTLCDKVCQWLAAGRCFSSGTPDSSTNKTDRHEINVILLKVAFNTTTLSITHPFNVCNLIHRSTFTSH
jgi:hypothetical protein